MMSVDTIFIVKFYVGMRYEETIHVVAETFSDAEKHAETYMYETYQNKFTIGSIERQGQVVTGL